MWLFHCGADWKLHCKVGAMSSVRTNLSTLSAHTWTLTTQPRQLTQVLFRNSCSRQITQHHLIKLQDRISICDWQIWWASTTSSSRGESDLICMTLTKWSAVCFGRCVIRKLKVSRLIFLIYTIWYRLWVLFSVTVCQKVFPVCYTLVDGFCRVMTCFVWYGWDVSDDDDDAVDCDDVWECSCDVCFALQLFLVLFLVRVCVCKGRGSGADILTQYHFQMIPPTQS